MRPSGTFPGPPSGDAVAVQTTWLPTPLGHLMVTATTEAVLVVQFAPDAAPPVCSRDTSPLLREAVAQLMAYFVRRLERFDLPLAPRGSAFQQLVWARLLEIPYGTTVTYGDLANRVGRRGAARAVGGANHRNPIGIVIPCHRVVGRDGTLTGYASGLERKAWLLALEGAQQTPPGPSSRGDRPS